MQAAGLSPLASRFVFILAAEGPNIGEILHFVQDDGFGSLDLRPWLFLSC
jgi:hypothetical protein